MSKYILKSKLEKPAAARPRKEVDEKVMAQFMASALGGMIASNVVLCNTRDSSNEYDWQGMSHDDIQEKAIEHALDMYQRWEDWKTVYKFEEAHVGK